MPDDFRTRLDRAFVEGKPLMLNSEEVCALSLELNRLRELETVPLYTTTPPSQRKKNEGAKLKTAQAGFSVVGYFESE